MRRAEKQDTDLVVELTVRAYARHTEALGAPPIPVTEDYAPRVAAGEVWLMEDEGQPVGLIVLEDNADSLMIFSVAVAPERQGEGLGQRLLAFAQDEALKRGKPTLALYTNARMEQNIALYRRFGFQETGRQRNALRPGWIRVDMEKPLAADTTRRTAL